MSKLNQHVKSDKVKWIITGIALVLILALLGGVIAMLVMNRNSGEEEAAVKADQTLCLNLTSIDELVGYEFNEASDWTQIATEASADGYSAFSLLSIDTFSPAFDEEGMFEILGTVESVTIELNGTTYEMTASGTDGTQHMFQDAERTMYLILGTADGSFEVSDQKYDCVFLGVGANAPIESFKIVSFNMPATEDPADEEQGEESVPAYYTVTFDSNGGTEMESQIVLPGGKVVEPEDPTKPSLSFMGWYLADQGEWDSTHGTCTGGVEWDFNDPVTSDLVLKANWL